MPAQSSQPPTLAEMEAALRRALLAQGLDPDRIPSRVPTTGSEVVDLTAVPIDPDGSGPQLPTGYLLRWTERLAGDHDQNGEANGADLQPIATGWQQTVQYDDPLSHSGFASYPSGNPEFDGDVPAGTAPVIGSGAHNWRLARIDSDGNGEVNIAEITSLAKHLGERMDGYRVYRRRLGDVSFTRLDDPANPGQALLIPRSAANGGTGIDPLRPVRYSYVHAFALDVEYEYRVLPYDAVSGMEGPPSLPGFGATANLVARLTADRTQGASPLNVVLDASGSTVQIGSITGYYWDLDGDGVYEVNGGTTPTLVHTFLTTGTKRVGLGVAASGGETATTELQISVTLPPKAVLTIPSPLREAPLTLTLSASSSTDADGEVVRYIWDMDGDGVYEMDTGPIGQRQVAYTAAGDYTVGVRVVDNLGANDTASLGFTLTDDYEEVEPNDNALAATLLGSFPATASIAGQRGSIGPGAGSYDGDMDDWFAFDLPAGLAVTAELWFIHAQANLDIQLLASNGQTVLAQATGQADGETLDARLLKAGRYYLRVYRGLGAGGNSARYTLGLTSNALAYDEVEPNNTPAQAQNIGSIDLTLLPSFWGRLGSPAGDNADYFRFSVGFASDFDVRLRFFHDQADLELQVYSGDGLTLLGASSSVSDNEMVRVSLTPGDYIVRCFRFGTGAANYELSILLP